VARLVDAAAPALIPGESPAKSVTRLEGRTMSVKFRHKSFPFAFYRCVRISEEPNAGDFCLPCFRK
jgi:hypothetical protein